MSSAELNIRRACRADMDVLVRFNLAMALETERRQLDQERLRYGILAVLESRVQGFYIVAQSAEESGSVIGQLMVTYEWSDWRNADFWWIQSVYVHPSWRRQGVYRRMHAHVLQEARARPDVCGIRLYVDQDNHLARLVYQRVGLNRSGYLMFETDFVHPRGNQVL
jgi:GNAT superfamily N-acetyltransferase